MSWFSDGKQVEVRRTINRFLNTTTSLASHLTINAASDQREDMRVDRITPVVIVPLVDEGQEDGLNLGLTSDLSSEGMAVSSLGALPVGQKLAIGMGSGEHFCVLLGECVRSASIGYGFYESGVRLLEVLPERDFAPLKDFAHYLEKHPPKNLLALMDNTEQVG